MIDVSIVVVSWNTRALVLRCLASIEREARDAELELETLVVDNGSRDGSADAIETRFPWARLSRLPRNRGFAAGANQGLAQARGRHVLLLNSDAELGRGVLERCVRYLDEHPEVGVVGPQLLNPDGSRQNSFHNFPLLATELLPKGLLEYLFRRRFPSRRFSGARPLEVEAVRGAALFLRRELLKEVGPLPEEYFFFMEETAWCWRVRAAGWRVVHLPHAHVIHRAGASSKQKDPTATRIEYHRSLYRFFRGHRGRVQTAMVQVLRFSKTLFYLLTQAPLALVGTRHRARWSMHREVFAWHLRGCPAAAGLAGAEPEGRP